MSDALPDLIPDDTAVLPRELLGMAVRTARAEPARVLIPALLIFGLDACNTTFFTEVSVDHLGDTSVLAAVSLVVSTLGLTFYSGMLERLVGAKEQGLEVLPLGEVMRTLPYGRLLLADMILWFAGEAASLILILPGIILYTLFALIGPIINLEDASVWHAFRRSATLVRPRFVLVLTMVTLPLAVEHELVLLIAYLLQHEHIWEVYLTNLALGVISGVSLGLVEVSLAERLINGARGPGVPSDAPLPST